MIFAAKPSGAERRARSKGLCALVKDDATLESTGIGDEAGADMGPSLGSINVIAGGQWIRISASRGYGTKPLEALPALALNAVGRLP